MPDFPLLTDEQIDAEVFPGGMAARSVLASPYEIRRYARAIESATRAPLLAEIERLTVDLAAEREDADRRVAEERKHWRTLLSREHVFRGGCPDAASWHDRDPECPACRALGDWRA